MPCKKDDCIWEDRFSEPVPFQKCTKEKETEIYEHMLKNWKSYESQGYGSNILCLDTTSFYLAGKPDVNSEASLLIGIQRNPDFITDDDHPDFNKELYESYDEAAPVLFMTLNQVDMKTGDFSRVIRENRRKGFRIELSMNTFLNRNNYLGLIHAEPDP